MPSCAAADGGDVAARAGADDDQVEALGHVASQIPNSEIKNRNKIPKTKSPKSQTGRRRFEFWIWNFVGSSILEFVWILNSWIFGFTNNPRFPARRTSQARPRAPFLAGLLDLRATSSSWHGPVDPVEDADRQREAILAADAGRASRPATGCWSRRSRGLRLRLALGRSTGSSVRRLRRMPLSLGRCRRSSACRAPA